MQHDPRVPTRERRDAIASLLAPFSPPVSGIEGFAEACGQRLVAAALHEFYAATEADTPGMSALALQVCKTLGANRHFVWIRHVDLSREAGSPYPPGLVELGIDPASLLLVRGHSVRHVLQAGLEAARCLSAPTVLMEFRGAPKLYDLIASRRLMHAARESGARVLLLRSAALPSPSAAHTRWLVRAARSSPLTANAPGAPAFHLTLLRDRRGQEGLAWTVEWNRDQGCLEDRAPQQQRTIVAGRAAPVFGGVVAFPAHRPDAAAARRTAG